MVVTTTNAWVMMAAAQAPPPSRLAPGRNTKKTKAEPMIPDMRYERAGDSWEQSASAVLPFGAWLLAA